MSQNAICAAVLFDEITECLRSNGILSAVFSELTCEPDCPPIDDKVIETRSNGLMVLPGRMGTYGDVVIRLKVIEKKSS